MVLFQTVLTVFSFVEGIGTLQALLLIAGLVLLIIEMFLPGFGVAGVSGLVVLLVAIVLTARTAFEAFMMILLLILLIGALVALVLRSAKSGKLSRKLILHAAARQTDGFSATADSRSWVGHEGVALTVLRPAGSGEFDGQRLDVVTDGAFIESGTRIQVVRTEGRRIVVKPIETPNT